MKSKPRELNADFAGQRRLFLTPNWKDQLSNPALPVGISKTPSSSRGFLELPVNDVSGNNVK